MNWSSYVNESLYFAQLQLGLMHSAKAVPHKIAAERAAVFFLRQAFTGFLNELAHKRRVKEQVKDLVELEQKLAVESAEIRQLKRAGESHGWLAELEALALSHSRPRAEISEAPDNIIAVSGGNKAATDAISQILNAMKRCFSDLRESSTEC